MNECHYLARLEFIHFDCAPADITDAIGIEPTETFKRGEKLSPRWTIMDNAWRLVSPESSVYDSEGTITALLTLLERDAERTRDVVERHKGSIWIDASIRQPIDLDMTLFGFGLSAAQLDRLARLGLSVRVLAEPDSEWLAEWVRREEGGEE